MTLKARSNKLHLRDWPHFYNVRSVTLKDKTLCGLTRDSLSKDDNKTAEIEKRKLEQLISSDKSRICKNCMNCLNLGAQLRRMNRNKKEITL